MNSVVFKLALAVILAAAVFFILASVFHGVDVSVNTTAANMESARWAGLNKSVEYLQR